MAELKPVTHVIFGMDGLILDSQATHIKALNEIASEYNRGLISLETQHKYMLGRTTEDLIKTFIRQMFIPLSFERTLDKYNELTKDRLAKIKQLPGAQRLVCHFYKHEIPIALVTNSTRDEMMPKFTLQSGMFQNFKPVLCYGDEGIENGKPSPEMFLKCLEMFDAPPIPESCLVIEDSPVGVKAACCAGMQVVMIPDPLLLPEYQTDATKVVANLGEFKPEEFGLPEIPR